MEHVGYRKQVKSAHERAFEHYLRTGEQLTTAQWLERELKYNQWHRSDNGQFDFARGGSSGGASVGNDALHWGSASSRGASVAQSTQHSDTRRPTPNQTGVATPRPIPTQSPAPPLTADHIRAVLPGAGSYAEVHANPINRAMARYRIETPEQQAFFLAQVSVESQNLQKVTEDLNYSASRITEVWGIPARTAQRYAHNPVALANYAYANKNGNGNEASGDGWRFRGRGIMHVTGRDTYAALGFEKDPDAVLTPFGSAFAAAGFFKWKSLIAPTHSELNHQQFDALTRKINAANLAGDLRWRAYQRALALLRPKSSAQ